MVFFTLLGAVPLWWLFLGYKIYVAWLTDTDIKDAKPEWVFDRPIFDNVPSTILGAGIVGGLLTSLVAVVAGVVVEAVGFKGTLIAIKWALGSALTVWIGAKLARVHKRLYKMRETLGEKCEFFRELIGKPKKDN